MANVIVPDFKSFMNNHVDAHEDLGVLLSKAQALSFVLMKVPLDECPGNVIEDYLWSLNDILTESINQNELHLKQLMTIIREKNLCGKRRAGGKISAGQFIKKIIKIFKN